MKFCFFGTDTFSVAILEKLINDFYHPEVVISRPDKPVGRKLEMTPPAIKDVCIHHNIPILQPEKISDIYDDLKKPDLDLIITASFGRIIPDNILSLPKKGSVNVHTSLLPKYRGASPIQQAILDGQSETGITIMVMDEEMDHGPVIFQKSVDISPNETYRTLHTKLATKGAEVLTKVLPDYMKGRLKPREQDHDKATFTKLINKQDAKIDWSQSCQAIERSIRAYYDWPIAWTELPDGKRLKIIEAHIHDSQSSDKPGQLNITKNSAAISCADGLLELDLVQVEGGNKPLTEEEFIRGYERFDGEGCK